MESFLSQIAWKMPVFSAGSAAHIVILVLVAGILIVEAAVLWKIEYDKSRILPVIGFLLMVMEVFKQIFLTWVRGGAYSWSDFPFQLCSMPMYLMVLYPLLKEKRCRTVEGFLMTFGMIGGVAALAEPVSIFSQYVVLTLHSLVWHILLVAVSVLILEDRRKQQSMGSRRDLAVLTEPRKQPRADAGRYLREYQPVGGLYLLLAALAVMTNACLREVSSGTANMFFMGPSWPDMFVLNDIYEKSGWIAETVLFAAVTWTAGLVIYILFSVWTGRQRSGQETGIR